MTSLGLQAARMAAQNAVDEVNTAISTLDYHKKAALFRDDVAIARRKAELMSKLAADELALYDINARKAGHTVGSMHSIDNMYQYYHKYFNPNMKQSIDVYNRDRDFIANTVFRSLEDVGSAIKGVGDIGVGALKVFNPFAKK